MKTVILLPLCILLTAFFSVQTSAAGSSARILIALPESAAGNAEFMKAVNASETFTRNYFTPYADIERVTVQSIEPENIYPAAAAKNAAWALVFTLDDGECIYRAYDCRTRTILTYENESAHKVDLERSGDIDLWTGKDLYAILYQRVLSENRFFISNPGNPDASENRMIVSSLISDEKSRAAFPEISQDITRALTASSRSLQPLSSADCRYPADFYRFINSADQIRSYSRIWNARWYLAGSLFEDKGSYKLYLYLIDCTGTASALICETAVFNRDELTRIVTQSAEKVSILTAGAGSGSGLENRSLALLYEYSRKDQNTVYSFCQSPQGDMYLSALMTVLHFSANGTLLDEIVLHGDAPGESRVIYKVRTDAQGNIYFLDYVTGKVRKYSRGGDLIKEISIGMLYPMSMAVNSDGTIAVPENAKNSLTLISAPYLEPKTITVRTLSRIAGVFFHHNTLYAWGTENAAGIRTVEVNSDGSTGKEQFLSIPNFFSGHVTRDNEGNFFAIEQTAGYLLKTDPAGKLLWLNRSVIGMQGNFNMPSDLTVGSDGRILIADMMNRRTLVLKDIQNYTPCADSGAYLLRAQNNPDKTSDMYCADIQAAAKGGSARAAEELADMYTSMNYFDPAMALLEKKITDRSASAISQKIANIRFRSYVYNGNLFSARISRMLEVAGVESARPLYTETVKNYELALKIRPEDRELQKRYLDLKNIFEHAAGEIAPKIEITGISTIPVFAALYKYYNENELGTVIMRNTTGQTIDSVFARIEVKGYMDYPTESRTHRGIGSGSEQKVKLFAVFNNNILSITEDTPLSAQISIIYRINGKEYTESKTIPLNVYNRNALVWDDAAKLSSFVTPKDPVVSVFSRGVLNRFRNSRFSFMNSNLLSAMQIFDSLGVYGITYVKDPKTPFAVFSKNRTQVDFIQYPRDTLRFKTGDCDDLTVLTSSLLENVGIETATVTVPGHIFLMFNTGVPESSAGQITGNENLIVIRSGTVWIPVETTMLGKPFLRAWDESAKTFARYKNSADLSVNSVHEGWEKYAPVSLNETQWSPQLPDADVSEKLYFDDINSLIERELQRRILVLKDQSLREPANPAHYNSMGITYARYGKYQDAEECFRKAISLNPGYTQSHQNMGNIFLLQQKYPQAEEYYRKASELMPGNANLYINLAVLYDKMNRQKDLEKAYARAVSIDVRLGKQYAYLIQKNSGSKASAEENANVIWGE